ncbi:MAG: hypothetical protein ABSE73_03605 [Planctomycetota bacterium]
MRKADNVGLVALGSLAGNMLQLLQNRNLAQREEQLTHYAAQLRELCQAGAAEYVVLRQQYESLWQHCQRLSTDINQLQQRNNDLELQRVQDANEIRQLRAELRRPAGARP